MLGRHSIVEEERESSQFNQRALKATSGHNNQIKLRVTCNATDGHIMQNKKLLKHLKIENAKLVSFEQKLRPRNFDIAQKLQKQHYLNKRTIR